MMDWFLVIIISVKMMKNDTQRNLFRDQSNKSLSRFKLDGQGKINRMPLPSRIKEESNSYKITTNVANYSSCRDDTKKEEAYLKRIKILENQLKKNLLEDNILRNLFKTKTTNDISHIDIFLEFRKLEELFKDQMQIEKQLKERLEGLQKYLHKQQEQHIQNMQMLGASIQQKEDQWKSEKHQLQSQNKRLQEECQNYKFLMEQIKKKYGELNKRFKDACDELQIQKSAKILGQLKEKEEHEGQMNQLTAEILDLKRQNSKLLSEISMKDHEINEYVRQLQEITDCKQKLELRIKQCEEMSYDFKIQFMEEKEKCSQLQQRLRLEYEEKVNCIRRQYEQALQLQDKKEKQIESWLSNKVSNLQDEIQSMKAKLTQSQLQIDSLQVLNKQFIQKQLQAQKQIANLEKKNVKMSIQLMQVRFQKDEQLKQFEKERSLFEEKQNTMRNFETRRMTQSKNSSGFKSEIQKKYFRS